MNETETETIPPRVLVVEDDACVALLYKNLLEREGYSIQHCPDGEVAIQALSENNFDAVVLDLMMPRADGIQVLKTMRTLPAHMLTPVIVMTAARLRLVQDEAIRLGVKYFLEKTQKDDLLDGLRKIMAEKASAPTGLRMAAPPPLDSAVAEEADAAKARKQPMGLGRLFRRRSG